MIAGDGHFHHFAENIQVLFPKALRLVSLGAVSYAAAPIYDSKHNITGHVVILDTKPLKNEAWIRSIIEAYAIHSGLELERRQTQSTIEALTKGYGLPIRKDCFRQLAQIAADTFDIDFAIIGQQSTPNSRTIESLAIYHYGEFLEPMSYSLDNAPCDGVVGKQARAFPADLQMLYPDFSLFQQLNAQAYIGVPLFDSTNVTIGIFFLINQQPIHQPERIKTLLEAFATKAAYR